MSMPLELTIYPPVPPNPRPAEPLTRMNPKFRACMEWDDARAKEQRLTCQKRLTNAELAAEVFSAVFHEAECEVRGLRLALRDPGHPAIDHWAAHNHEFGRQAEILERFATLPHYDRERA